MFYVTLPRVPFAAQQISFDNLFDDGFELRDEETTTTGTVTRITDGRFPVDYNTVSRLEHEINIFHDFNLEMIRRNKNELYRHYSIPKRNGGRRDIDDPCDELRAVQAEFVEILKKYHCGYHTAAFAYVKGRSTVDCCKMHAEKKSNWFLHLDMHHFFPSINLDFMVRMLHKIYPFSHMNQATWTNFTECLTLCLLNDSMPQGTNSSPFLSNLIMIPFDHYVANRLWHEGYCYTRYADDLIISRIVDFNTNDVISVINKALTDFACPFRLNNEKTRYGSVAGHNVQLGLHINAEHNITVGAYNKKVFKARLCNFFNDFAENNFIDRDEAMELQGITSYYLNIEHDYFSKWIMQYEVKFNIRFKDAIAYCINR